MKKLISLILSVLIFAGITLISVSAVSLGEGSDAMIAAFEQGESALDYCYFSPVKDENDDKKYPLVLWLHGNSSGNYPGHQVENSDIFKFASDEFQARFRDAGGAFLLLPRDDTNDASLAWDMKIEAAMETLIDFVSEYKDNIDVNRIYVGGNSMGGKGAYKIAATYPGVFAAIFPISPVYVPTPSDINALKDTPVWVFSNKNDRYPQLMPSSVSAYFNQLSAVSSVPENCRWTIFDVFCYPDGRVDAAEVHNTWTPVLNDLFMYNGDEYIEMTTVDGKGNEVHLTYPEGFIHWLSSQSLEESSLDVDSVAEVNIFKKIIQFFVNIINAIISIFGM